MTARTAQNGAATREQTIRALAALGATFTPLNGKIPLRDNWQHEPPLPLNDILAHRGNIGLRTGGNSGGIIVIDVDTAKGADESPLNLPRTITVRTGSGGRHYYFRCDKPLGNSAGKLAPHIDVKADGGQVVCPGSLHPKTKERYEFIDGCAPGEVEIALLPEWIFDALTKPKERKRTKNTSSPTTALLKQKYAESALKLECRAVCGAPKGERNDTLNRAAFKCGQLVAAGVLDRETAHAELFNAAIDAGLSEIESDKTINSGLNAGEKQPREIPDLQPLKNKRTAPRAEANKARSFDDLLQQVIEIFADPDLRARAKKREVSDLVIRWMREHDRLYRDRDGACYLKMDDGSLEPLHTDSLPLRVLLSRICINATEALYKFILSDLEVAAMRYGREIEFSRYTAIRDGAIYLSSGAREIIKITTAETSTISNGTDDIWFARDDVYPEWKLTTPVSPIDVAALSPILQAPHECARYTPEIQLKLMHCWILAVAIGIRPVPSLCLVGAMDCGKTTTARAIIKAIRGAHFDVQALPTRDRDLQTVLCAAPCIGLDNTDGEVEQWFPDCLAMAVTGGRVEFRKLYANGALYTKPITAAIVLSTRTPHFCARPDIQSRILPIFFGERRDGQRIDDSKLMAAVNRDGLMSWAAQQGKAILAPSVRADRPGRFQRFAELVNELDPFDGADGLRFAYQAARVAVVETHPLISAILSYGKRLHGTAAEIISELAKAGHDLKWLGGGKAVLHILREHRHAIRLVDLKQTNKGTVVTLEPLFSDESEESDGSSILSRKKEEENKKEEGEKRKGIGKTTTFFTFVTREATP